MYLQLITNQNDLDLKLQGTHYRGLDDAKKIAKILQQY